MDGEFGGWVVLREGGEKAVLKAWFETFDGANDGHMWDAFKGKSARRRGRRYTGVLSSSILGDWGQLWDWSERLKGDIQLNSAEQADDDNENVPHQAQPGNTL